MAGIWEALWDAANWRLGQQTRWRPVWARSGARTHATGRLGHVVKATFLATNRQGQLTPAYARYISISGSNFISNAWRLDSEASVGNAAFRTLLGFVGRMSSNAFQEFSPDVRHRFSGQELNAKVLPTTKNLPISASEPDH